MKTQVVGTLRTANILLEFKNTLISIALLFGMVANANATARTWTNGGGTNNWGDASNWAPAGVPAAADALTFNATSTANCNINVQVNCTSISVNAGYTGTITQNAGDSIVLSSNMSMAAGTFVGGNQRIDINGGLTLGTCTFTSTTGSLYVQNNLTFNAGTVFNHNNGTLYFDQAGTTTVNFPGNSAAIFYNVIFNSTVGTTITAGDTLVVQGQLSLMQNQVKTGILRLASGSTLVTNAAFAGGNAVLDVQSAITITPPCSAFMGINLNNASAVFNAPAFTFTMNAGVQIFAGTFNGGSNDIAINGAFKQTGGTFTSTTGNLSVDGNFTYTAGTFNNNSGTVTFTSATNATFTNGGKISLYNAVINKAAAANTLTLAATDTLKATNGLTLTTGTLNGGYMQPTGSTFGIASTYAGGTTILLITGATNYTVGAGMNVPPMTMNNASAVFNFSAGATPVCKGAVSLKNGTFNCGSTNWTMTQALSITGGTFNASTGTTTYSNAALTISTGATFNHNNGSWVFSLAASGITVTNSLKTLFYDMTINLTNVATASARFAVAASDTVVAVHSLTLTAGNFNSGVIEARGTITDNSAFGAAANAGQLIIANGTGSRNITLVSALQPAVTLNDASATLNCPQTTAVTFGSNLKVMAGDFFPDAYAITITGTTTIGGGNFWNGTANVTHTGATTISGGNYYPTSATTLFTGAFSQSAGTFNQGTGPINYSSTLSISGGNYYPTTGTTAVTGAFNQTGGTFQTGGGILNLNSTWGLTTGTFNPPTATMTVTGVATMTSGTYAAGTKKQVFNNTVSINGGTYTATSDTTVIGGSSLTIAAAATWSSNSGTYDFNRAAGGITVANPTTTRLFYNARINLTNATPASARFTETAGNIIAVTNSLALVAGNIFTGGTIEARGAIVDGGSFGGGIGVLSIVNGPGSRTINFTSATIPGLIINEATSTVNATSSQATTIGGAFTITTGTFNPGSYAVTVTGAAAQSGGTFSAGTAALTFSSTFTLSGGTFNPPSAFTIFTGAYSQTNGTVATGSAKASMRNTVSITGGTFNAPTDTLEFQGTAVTISAIPTFNHNNGTLSFNQATGNATLTPPIAFKVYNFYVNLTNSTNNILTIAAGDTVIVNNRASLAAGKINTGMLELRGDISNLTSFSGGSATVIVSNGTGVRSVNLPATTIGNLTMNDANVTTYGPTSGTLTLSGNFLIQKGTFTGGAGAVSVTGTYTQTGGTFTGGAGDFTIAGAFAISGVGTAFTAPSGNLTLGGNITITSPATFAHNGGTLTANGGVSQTLAYTTAGNLTLKNLAVNTTGGAQLIPNISTGFLVLTGNLSIGSAGILNISTNNEDINLAGNYNDQNASGGLTYGTRTVTFNGGSGQTVDGANGTENFYNVTMSNTSGGVTLNTSMYVNHTLALTAASNCKVVLNNANLTINSAGTITGGTASEFVVTGGTGYLRQENIGSTGRSGSILFPVGPTTTNYTPVTVLNAGTNDRFDVHIFTHALTAGTTGSPIYSAALDQTYLVEEQTPGGSNVTLTLQWNGNNELPGFDRTNCGIKHYTGGSWITEGTLGLASGAGPYTSTAAGITSFSPFDEGSGGGSLPVELASFTGVVDNSKVALHWTTEVEINNNFFTLERSADGVEFTEVTRVDGMGNSTVESNYSYLDAEPLSGTSYYRLKQTDFDGEFKYVGGTVAINLEKTPTTTLTVSPNPLEGREIKMTLSGTQDINSKISLDVTDISGRNVYHADMSPAQQLNVNLPETLSKGMYFMQVNAGTQVYKQKLLVK